jgi:hypothetical protein
VKQGNNLRPGKEYDTNGKQKRIIWLNYESEKPVDIEIKIHG